MPGTSPQAQQLQRLLTKFSLWEMMQSTNVQHLFECMAALVCCCDAQMLQLDPAAPLPSSSKTPEYVLAVVQGRGSTAPGMTGKLH